MAFSTGQLDSKLSYFSTSPLIPNFLANLGKMYYKIVDRLRLLCLYF